MTIQSEPTKPSEVKITRKPYHKPDLVVYGNIRDLTQSQGKNGNSDGGTGSNKKTQ